MKAVSDFDLRLLMVFKTVVECGGLSASQSALDMSLSNISTHMANLEKRVGFKICHRGRSGFRLTSGGAELYASVEDLFQSIDHFRNKAFYTKNHVGKELSLGIIDGLISERQFSIQTAIQTLAVKERGVFIRMDIMPPNKLKSSLAEGDIDVAIGPTSIVSSSVVCQEIFRENIALFCSRSHELAEPESQEKKLIQSDTPFAFVSRGYLRESQQPSYIDNLRTAAIVHTMEAAAMLILSGKYIGYLPEHFARKWEDTNEMIRVLPNRTSHSVPFGVMHRRDQRLSRGAKLLIEHLRPGGSGGDASD
ncbi:LysR family transcriptional regulator [Aminobacter aminovorans]|uniref:DNA-binding transcriptional regulator CynR n=1 Tax=Aminobacter aminovorans TaxID=83263 RepID=A0A381IKP4_AMIAI|nr:LysR family transcriptional regulator [Aminobacter aminovorans]TCS25027.1 LysR family transcriptional regulator [Aminobacter aminovorans]SUY28521.1 DNA-binding transcriptional regulator CynR [Aminobacter aminovorans]